METKVQLLSVLVIAVMATHLVPTVSSSRLLLHSNSAVPAADATTGEHDSLSNEKFQLLSRDTTTSPTTTTISDSKTLSTSFVTDYGNQKVSASKTTSSSETPSTTETERAETDSETTAPYFPDYETHDNSPGFNGRRR